MQKGEAGRKTLGASSSRGAGPSETLTATGLSQGGGGKSLLEPRMFGIWGPANETDERRASEREGKLGSPKDGSSQKGANRVWGECAVRKERREGRREDVCVSGETGGPSRECPELTVASPPPPPTITPEV